MVISVSREQDSEPKTAEYIQEIIRAKGLTQKEFSELTKVPEQNLSGILKGTRRVGDKITLRISKAFGLPFDAVRFGIGLKEALEASDQVGPLVTTANRLGEREAVFRSQRQGLRPYSWNQEGMGVPFYDVDVFAGDVVAFNDSDFYPDGYLQMPGVADCDFACRVSGSSMVSKIYPGAIIVCKEITDRRIIAFGEIHLVITPEQRFVKYLRRNKDIPGAYLLKSHNIEGHDDIDVMPEDILRLFLVKVIINQEQL